MPLTSITSFWFVVKPDLHCHFSIFFFPFWSSYLQRKAYYLYQTSPLQFWKWILHPPYRLPITFLILPGFHGASQWHACLLSLLSNHPFVTSQGNAATCMFVWALLFSFVFSFWSWSYDCQVVFFLYLWTCVLPKYSQRSQCNWNITNQ